MRYTFFMKLIIPFVLIALGLVGLYISYQSQRPLPPEPVVTEEAPVARYMDIESYVRNSISELSPIKEQLGGTFYVTKIEMSEGMGLVEYEDGHNAYVADFTYSVAEDGKPTILTFTIRPE
ncbi:MAG: hypothetical protein AB199_03560 [Parcubacteria bacterium C7867-004]|nr:MAG: hypothetical protein AB199_03560 [Parcubacteria bacterium C7867-004]